MNIAHPTASIVHSNSKENSGILCSLRSLQILLFTQKEIKMFFLLQKRVEPNTNQWRNLGVVVAASMEDAATKLGREIDEYQYQSDTGCFLKSRPGMPEYSLEYLPEFICLIDP